MNEVGFFCFDSVSLVRKVVIKTIRKMLQVPLVWLACNNYGDGRIGIDSDVPVCLKKLCSE